MLLYEHHYSFLKTETERQGKTTSGLLREIIDNYLQNQAREDDPLWDLIGMAEGEGKAIGREHDKYLYGDKR